MNCAFKLIFIVSFMLERSKGFETELREVEVLLRTMRNIPVVPNHYGRHVANI